MVRRVIFLLTAKIEMHDKKIDDFVNGIYMAMAKGPIT